MSSAMTAPAGAEARLAQLRRDLEAERRKTARSTTLAAILGVVALIALGIYFAFGYKMIDETTQPRRLVEVASTLVQDNLPAARQSLQEQVAASAPVWAEGLSQQAQAALPSGREQIETYVLDQVETSLTKGTVLTEDRLRTFLRQNSARLERDIQDLSGTPEQAEKALASIQEALERELQADMLTQSRDFHAALSGAVDKLKRYQEGVGLTPDEQDERRILLLLRALQQQPTRPPTAPVSLQRRSAEPEPQPGNTPKPADAPAEKAESPKADPAE